MDEKNSLISTPTAILIGSIIISLAIFISNGNIKLNGNQIGAVKGVKETPTVETDSPQVSTVTKLKNLAQRVGLDQNKFDNCLDSGELASQVDADLTAGQNAGVGGTPAFMLNGKVLNGGAFPYEVFKKIVDFELSKGDWNNPPEDLKFLTDGNDRNGEISKEVVDSSTGNLPLLGNPNAAVTLVEYSDYQCPFCARFYIETEKQLKTEYIDSSKIKIYFRDFPLKQIHPGAQKASEAARCANAQGKFWQYHDLIFENQSQIF